MTLPGAFLPPLIGGVFFAAVIGIELISPIMPESPAAESAGSPEASLGSVVPVQSQGAALASAVETILARPLYVPGRRSRGGEANSHADGGVPRLAGIVIDGNRQFAVFQGTGIKPVSLVVGDRVGVWIIQSINRHGVVLQGPGGTMTLEPANDSTLAATGAVRPAVVPMAPQMTMPKPSQPQPQPMSPSPRVRP